MHVGLQVPHFRPSTPENRREWFKNLAQKIEVGGFYSLWVMDHFHQLGFWLGEPVTEMMEGYMEFTDHHVGRMHRRLPPVVPCILLL